MENWEKAQIIRNKEKEDAEKRFYEIPKQREDELKGYEIPNGEIVFGVCQLLKKQGLTYREANEALYHADKVLHELAMTKSL